MLRILGDGGQTWLPNSPAAGNAGLQSRLGTHILTLLLGLNRRMRTTGLVSLSPICNYFIFPLKWMLDKINRPIRCVMITGRAPQTKLCSLLSTWKHDRKIHLKIITSLSIVPIFQRCFMNGNCYFGNGPLRVCGYLAVTEAKGLQGFSTWTS